MSSNVRERGELWYPKYSHPYDGDLASMRERPWFPCAPAFKGALVSIFPREIRGEAT